jgi:hypothetical protein
MVGRHIVEGHLGCPVCESVYRVERGDVLFVDRPSASPLAALEYRAVLQTAAMLDLADPGGVVLLVGAWAEYAAPLADMADVQILLVDPGGFNAPEGRISYVDTFDRVSVIYAGGAIPLAAGSVRAAATDAPAAVVRAVRPGGRVVAPVGAAVPEGVKELARDERYWVGEVSLFLSLSRRTSGR